VPIKVYITEQPRTSDYKWPRVDIFVPLFPIWTITTIVAGASYPLYYRDPSAQFANLAPGLRRVLSNQLGVEITSRRCTRLTVACIVAHPEFTTRHQAQLTFVASPGPPDRRVLGVERRCEDGADECYGCTHLGDRFRRSG